MKGILGNMNTVGQEESEGEVDDITRLPRYEKGDSGPFTIKLRSQMTTEAILNRSWRLHNSEKYKQILARDYTTHDERMTVMGMIME